jgi:deoxycytidylate deaminase
MAAAIVDKRGRLVSLGFNSYKTNPMAKKFNPLSGFLHAEMDAILKARREGFEDWPKATLYVARARKEKVQGPYMEALARPCPGCAKMISFFGITRVHHT